MYTKSYTTSKSGNSKYFYWFLKEVQQKVYDRTYLCLPANPEKLSEQDQPQMHRGQFDGNQDPITL
jgi:hypothetical protein